jgi:hypothetical protein
MMFVTRPRRLLGDRQDPRLPRFSQFFLRDLALTGIAAVTWTADRRLRHNRGPLAGAVGLAAGLAAPTVAFLVHEWGHLAGAKASGGVAHPASSLRSPFLFNFDCEASDRRQFLAMSAGGYIASALGLAAILARTPPTLSGKVARRLAALGVVVTAVLEVPTTVGVMMGGPLPSGGVYANDA